MSTAENILAAAETALLAADPGSLRVDRIAAAAGANKRMIYHYFSDRDGLLRAVYIRQLQRLTAEDAALTTGTKAVIEALLADFGTDAAEAVEEAVEEAEAEERVQPGLSKPSPMVLQNAAQILLPWLITRTAAQTEQSVSAEAWMCFCIEMMSLAFAQHAPMRFPAEPGSAEFMELSKRLLTASGTKHRVRITPDSRRHPLG